MLNGQQTLLIDQYGRPVWARTLAELRAKVPGRVSKQYVDKMDGRTVHNGYVVGSRWFTAFRPVEVEEGQRAPMPTKTFNPPAQA